ncbi:MAG: response regulator [Planctomycetota bacterium]
MVAPRILLVEDSAADAALVKALLGDRAQVEHAFELSPPPAGGCDCVLLDLTLAATSGLETLRAALARFDAPVVVLTGNDERGVAEAALQLGAQDYLPKQGLEPDLLERTIRHAIQRGGWLREREALVARLEEQRRQEGLGVLAGGLAHDFNNLIMTIRGFAELAQLRSSEVKQELDFVIEAADQASALTSAMLAYTGRQRRKPEPLDLRRVVEELPELYAAEAQAARSELRLEVDADPCVVFADPGQVRDALQHLVANALDATARQGGGRPVTVRVDRGDRPQLERPGLALGELPAQALVRVQVSDSGSGIHPDHLRQVCDPFKSFRPGGRGLGLAVVHGVVRSHSGSVRLDSVLGAGTQVELCFPRHGAAGLARASSRSFRAPAQSGSGRVLVIDDEPAVLAITVGLLEQLGYTPLGFTDRGEALRAVAADAARFEVVLMDLTMPGQVDAQEALRRLDTLRPGLPVVLASGYDVDDVLRLVGEAVPFLKKPYTLDELQRTLARTLSGT